MAQLPSVGHEQFYSILAANDDLVFMHVDEPGGKCVTGGAGVFQGSLQLLGPARGSPQLSWRQEVSSPGRVMKRLVLGVVSKHMARVEAGGGGQRGFTEGKHA